METLIQNNLNFSLIVYSFLIYIWLMVNEKKCMYESLIAATRTSRERSADPERKDFCSEDTNLHHYKGRAHVQDWGAWGQEGADEEQLPWREVQEHLSSNFRYTTCLVYDVFTCVCNFRKVAWEIVFPNHASHGSRYPQVPTIPRKWDPRLKWKQWLKWFNHFGNLTILENFSFCNS